MWLLDAQVDPPALCSFPANRIPPYTILSHTWGNDADEVTFVDIAEHPERASKKAGYAKIQGFCRKTKEEGYQYGWIDSCCIDKRSSAELSEAINSMYKWYQRAEVCYVYLTDVSSTEFGGEADEFASSRWFKRGWTLQELIAPRKILFFSAGWSFIGFKGNAPEDVSSSPLTSSIDETKQQTFLPCLAATTGIDLDVLRDARAVGRMSVAKRMSWASKRETTREEDMAYCLLGLFGVSMPILYGEGLAKAFRRLQLEIIRLSPDQTIFAWRSTDLRGNAGLLADSPADYVDSRDFFPHGRRLWSHTVRPFAMTNLGLFFNVPLIKDVASANANLYLCSLRAWRLGAGDDVRRVGIWLEKLSRTSGGSTQDIYRRVRCDELKLTSVNENVGNAKDIYVLEDEQYDLIMMLLANQAGD